MGLDVGGVRQVEPNQLVRDPLVSLIVVFSRGQFVHCSAAAGTELRQKGSIHENVNKSVSRHKERGR